MRRKDTLVLIGVLFHQKKQLRELATVHMGLTFMIYILSLLRQLMQFAKELKGFFEVYNIHAALSMPYSSYINPSLSRQQVNFVAGRISQKVRPDSHGFDRRQALSFEIDKQTVK